MSKANDTSSTIDWMWLCEALARAVEGLGTMALAKERLIEWLAAGELPWSCRSWKGLTAEELAKAEEQFRELQISEILPSAVYHEGEPKFWRVRLQIDWEDNAASEPATGGAKALGVRVSRTHLFALLPSEREEVHGTGAWVAAEVKRMKDAGEIPPDIKISDFARELAGRMRKAAARDRSIRPAKWEHIKNKLPAWGLWPVSLIR